MTKRRILGLLAGIACACACGGAGILGGGWWWWTAPVQPSDEAVRLFPLDDVPVPTFPARPDRADWVQVHDGVLRYELPLVGTATTPGHRGRLWVYLPDVHTEANSLPCVLVAPAGSTELTGMDFGEGDVPEHLPYVEAGMAVVVYSLDLPATTGDQPGLDEFEAFRAAQGGVVNARNAHVYARMLPEVDATRIYAPATAAPERSPCCTRSTRPRSSPA